MADSSPSTKPTVYVAKPVRMVRELYRDLCSGDWCETPIRDHLAAQADRLLAAHGEADPAAAVELGNWMERLAGARRETILGEPISTADAREAISRAHGFASWSEVDQLGEARPDRAFESAVDAVVNGRAMDLAFLLDEDGTLAKKRSNYGHASTLLHYTAANGVETRRQTVPSNAAQMARMLLVAGADPNARARVYGGEVGVLALVGSSAHTRQAGVLEELADAIMQAGGES